MDKNQENQFYQLGLTEEVSGVVEALGYTKPTPIQEQAIPHVLRGRDLFACAQTGTGKTASFTLPLIDCFSNSRIRSQMASVIILEPTRELAAQVYENFQKYSEKTSLKAVLLVGGESIGPQEKALKKGADFIIATPGRLIDMFERGTILLSGIKALVIDEADRMLDMGFIPDVDKIVDMLPKMRQTLLFSATMPDAIKGLSKRYLINPKEISVAPSAKTADTVDQSVVFVGARQKRDAMRTALKRYGGNSTVIFCNRKRDIKTLLDSLKRHEFSALGLHGDMHQSSRNEALEMFKAGKVDILVASDVAARGIDISGLGLVINFDVPHNAEDYVHRIGRTGRAGMSGRAVMLVDKNSDDDKKNLNDVQKLIQMEISDVTKSYQEDMKPAERQSPPRLKILVCDTPDDAIGFGEYTPAFFKLDDDSPKIALEV